MKVKPPRFEEEKVKGTRLIQNLLIKPYGETLRVELFSERHHQEL